MTKISKLRLWARDVGVTDRGLARLMGKKRSTVISWRRDDHGAHEPADWRKRLIKGLEQEIAKLKESDQVDDENGHKSTQ